MNNNGWLENIMKSKLPCGGMSKCNGFSEGTSNFAENILLILLSQVADNNDLGLLQQFDDIAVRLALLRCWTNLNKINGFN